MSEEVFGNPQKEKAGCFGIGFSFLMPIIGVILYFMQKDKVENPVAYLYGAGAGFIVSIFLNVLATAIQ